MSEKRPRGKKAEYPEFDPKPALEKLINKASKPSGKTAVESSREAHQEKQPEAPTESLSEKELEKLLLDAAIRNIESPDSFKEVLRTVFERTGGISPVNLERIRASAKQHLVGPGNYDEVEKYINEEGYRSKDPVSKEQSKTPVESLSKEQLGNHIISRENDAFLQEYLGRFDTLNFKPGFLPEELAKETNDAQLQIFLKKINEERKPLGVTFLKYINELREAGASPEAIQTMMDVAEKRLDTDMFKKLQGFVYNEQVHYEDKEKGKEAVEKNEVGLSKGGVVAVSPESGGIVPENLPHGSPDELEKFEKGLIESVGKWKKKRNKIGSKESLQANMPIVADDPSIVDAEWRSVSTRRMVEDARETVSSPPQDEPIVSHTEVPKGTFFTPEQEEHLSGERHEAWEPTTRAEFIAELRNLIFGERKSRGSNEQNEGLKTYITKRSEELGEKAKEYGPIVAGYIGNKIERYNKLGWKTKLAITGALVAGTALSAGVPGIISGGFTAALWSQRAIGAIGMGINKRKKLDAEIAANPEHKLAGKSEWEKNKHAALYATGYMLATSGAVYLGVEGLKAAAESEWLANMLGHHSDSLEMSESSIEVLPDPTSVQELDPTLFAEEKGNDQLRILAETSLAKHLTPNEWAVLNNHIASLTPRERSIFDQFTTEYSNKINAGQDVPEQILNNMPGNSETPPPDLSSPEAATIVPDTEITEKSLGAQSTDAPFGYDPIDGHAMSELEAQKLADLRNAMHEETAREAGGMPPRQTEEKGFFEKLFGSSDENPTETVGQFSIDSVSAAEPHIYADADGHLFAHGGSIEARIEEIQKFLTENPDKIVYGTDDNGQYRIPWYLYEGRALPSEPVRTNGFFGFGSVLMDAAKPEEFVKKIK